MPRPRFEKMAEGRKRALLDAARQEFSSQPYEAASINRILGQAGFSKGSFYYYFDDKADLAATVFIEAYQQPLALLRTARVPDSVAGFWAETSRMQRLMLEAIEATPSNYELFMRLASAVLEAPHLEHRLMPLFAETRALVTGMWAHGQILGAVRTDLSAAEVVGLVESVKRAAWTARYPGQTLVSPRQLEEFSAYMIDLAQRLAAPASTRPAVSASESAA